CKRLKLKCDRKTPCGNWAENGSLVRCIYSGKNVRPPTTFPIAADLLNSDLHS
ncbi:hypothetical protein K443DRAFT_90010, partial [Laccaria amethystina LaAM-08-1]